MFTDVVLNAPHQSVASALYLGVKMPGLDSLSPKQCLIDRSITVANLG